MSINDRISSLRKIFQPGPVSRGLLRRRQASGQSLVELAIFIPVAIIMLSGLVEFGFLLNQYLNILDGPREGARFAVDATPFGVTLATDNADFYKAVAGEVVNAIRPIRLNASIDDVVVSVFSVNGSSGSPVVIRYPNAGHLAGESPLDNTAGEWHLYGQGGACSASTPTCHPSTMTSAQVAARVAQTGGGALPPSMGVILVEIFYNYPQTLKLPWLTIAVPDPIPVHTYTIMPLPAAEPH